MGSTRKGNFLFRLSFLLIAATLFVIASLPVFADSFPRAQALYQGAHYKASIALLKHHKGDPAAMALLGRDYYMLGDFEKASGYLKKALAARPDNSDYADWLGRCYGKRAQTSNFLQAPLLASKARKAFERAVQLNPKNTYALSDLFDYYLNAPGILGGGYDKAASVAEKMSAIDPAEGYFEQAELSQKQEQFRLAENDLKKSVALGPNQPGHLIALAKLLAKEGLTGESDATFQKAQKAAPNAPRIWFAYADTLIQEKRNLKQAKALLEKYLNGPITANDPPRQEALNLLKRAGGI
ncbi:MAG TPA: tetratricopeptide repeat protein [Bryobacteraceae bacterium]